ncbi:Protein CLEC-62 b [Aphelenchoides avenae]|nr:Protein CLEC-62 b [Aphelenchus avenae]
MAEASITQSPATASLGSSTAYPWPPTERQCACSIDKLWLDTIIAIDTSSSMGETGVINIAGTLVTALRGLTVGQDLVHQSRVGIVTFDDKASVVAPLTKYHSFGKVQADLFNLTTADVDEVNVLVGLKAADSLLLDVNVTEYRQVVFVLVASAYREGEDDPRPIANQIKAAGHKLMVIAAVQNDEGAGEVANILKLASPGFAFRTDATGATATTDIRTALCRANCFCPNGWTQLKDSFGYPQHLYGECVRLSSSPRDWLDASRACARDNAFLVSEFSELKHKFNADYARSVYGQVVPYHIGLYYDETAGEYLWKETFPNGSEIPHDTNGFQPWIDERDDPDKHANAVQVVQSGLGTYWRKVDQTWVNSQFICQRAACDSDNYCDESTDSGDGFGQTPSFTPSSANFAEAKFTRSCHPSGGSVFRQLFSQSSSSKCYRDRSLK